MQANVAITQAVVLFNMPIEAHKAREASWDVTHDTEHRLRSENLAFDIGSPLFCSHVQFVVTAFSQMFGIPGWPNSLLVPSSFRCARARLLQSKRTRFRARPHQKLIACDTDITITPGVPLSMFFQRNRFPPFMNSLLP